MDARAGKPLIAMLTEPVNPFCAAVETVKLELELPGSAVIFAGDTPMLKSGAAIVNVSGAEWVNEPEVPVTVNGKLPTDAGTDNVTVWVLPTETVNGYAGEVVAPAGKPEIAMVTASLNPF